jgi:hypothetical protein
MLDRVVLYICIMAKKTKLPADTNKKAKSIVDLATGEKADQQELDAVKAAATTLGRLGGLKGGKARAKALTSKQRIEIAKKGAAKRWGNK